MLNAIRLANSSDIQNIAELVNLTYRPSDANISWTNESSYMKGNRISDEHIRDILLNPNAVILVAYEDQTLMGCVMIEKMESTAKIGMLTIRIEFQKQGFGKQLLGVAENYAFKRFLAKDIRMHVLTVRTELIDFYVRRGYQRTGIIHPYPVKAGFGLPLIDNLEFEVLTKQH